MNDINICGLAVGTELCYISKIKPTSENESPYTATIGKIESIYLGKKKNSIRISKFYPQDLNRVLSDIKSFEEHKNDILLLDTFFIYNKENYDCVCKLIDKYTQATKTVSKKNHNTKN